MTITDALVAEHAVFRRVFDHLERVLPEVNSLAELRLLCGVVEAMLAGHGDAERDLAYAALDQALEEQGNLDRLHQDHQEIDSRLRSLHAITDVTEARQRLLAALRVTREHFVREEEAVFPLVEQVLKRETLQELGLAWQGQQGTPASA